MSDVSPNRNLTYCNILTHQVSSFCNLPSFCNALHQMAAREGCHIGPKISYHFKVLLTEQFLHRRNINFNVLEALSNNFSFQW